MPPKALVVALTPLLDDRVVRALLDLRGRGFDLVVLEISPLPFVEGPAHEGGEEPVATGDLHQAIGELVTCSRCIGAWVAGGLATTQILAPRFGRLLTWTLGAAGLNDFLQAGFAALTHKSNELEQRTS